MVVATSLRKFGGEVEAAKGESEAREEESVTRMQAGLAPLVMAVLRSSRLSGDPLMMVTPSVAVMEEGLRTRTVAVWSVGRRLARGFVRYDGWVMGGGGGGGIRVLGMCKDACEGGAWKAWKSLER